MQYTTHYASVLGDILLSADSVGLTGLWFVGQAHFARGLDGTIIPAETAILKDAKAWLDIYFSGQMPDFSVPLHLIGTDFQIAVWQQLCKIPYGQTATYGRIAKAIGAPRACQAVGSAVGHNKISLFVPCHRVLGADGKLTGYAGGIEKKQFLLKLESDTPLTSPQKRGIISI